MIMKKLDVIKVMRGVLISIILCPICPEFKESKKIFQASKWPN